MEGKAVYPTFVEDVHVAPSPLESLEGERIVVGLDFGRQPAAAFCQRRPGGRIVVLHELCAQNMGTSRFAVLLLKEIAIMGWNIEEMDFWGDPTGSTMDQSDDMTPFKVLRAQGIICRPAPSNDPEVRIEAVEGALNRLTDGKPALMISPTCRKMIAGFLGGYQFRRMQITGKQQYDTKPDKNKFSHPHDALQYAALGMGEGRVATTGRRKAQQRAIKTGPASWNPMKASQKGRKSRHQKMGGFRW
jgi:hypothetical protein